jgi:uncharacterized protein (TIGR00369 family)
MAGSQLTEDLRRLMATTAFYDWMGLSLLDARPGEVDLALDAAAHHVNLQGLLHGGVLATLADTAGGLAIRTKLEPGRRHVTLQLGIQFLSAGSPGRIVGHGRAVRVGRQIAYAETQIQDEAGRLLATAQATVAVSTERRAKPSPPAAD